MHIMILNTILKYLILIISLSIIAFVILLNSTFADETFYPIDSTPFTKKQVFAGETIYPEGNPFFERYGIKFYLYNDGSGKLDLNLAPLGTQKTVMSPPVISPNLNNILYTEIYNYPNSQITSRCYYIPASLPKLKDDGSEITPADYLNSYNIRSIQSYRSEIISVGTNKLEDSGFRSLTVVDWSYDSTRAIIKEHVGRTYEGLAGTIPWVYDINADKAYRLEEIRKAIINYWFTEKALDLNQYSWDIDVLGWVKDSNSLFVVNAYLYPAKGQHKFLGCWSMDINQNMAQLLSLDDQNWPVGKYGLLPEKY